LALTNQSRNEHGLRHQDYQRYRQYCAKKIHRVRKTVGLTQGKKKYERKDVTAEIAKTDRHLQVLLYETERSWAYAMELQKESSSEPRKKHHMIKRLKRAAQTATQLEGLCQDREAETRTQLDVQAYAALMAGYVLFEQQEWQNALDKFATARTIYEKLAGAGGSSEQKVLCQAAIDAIDPNIRYCAYNLKLKGGQTMDIGELVAMRNQAGGSGSDILNAKLESLLAQSRNEEGAAMSITWRGKMVPTKNAKLMEAILVAKHAADQLDTAGHVTADARLELFDKVIGAWWEATRLAETDVKEDAVATAKVKSSKSDGYTANLQFTFGYVSYLRVSRTIQRNLLLIEETLRKLAQPDVKEKKAPKPEDAVRLHDTIIQAVTELQDMPAIQTDLSLQGILTAKLNLYKAKRVYHLARIYASTSKSAEALALYGRAEEYLTTAKAEADAVRRSLDTGKGGKGKGPSANVGATAEDAAELKGLEEDFREVQQVLRRAKIQEQAKWHLEAHEKGLGVSGITQGVQTLGLEETTKLEEELPLSQRLSTFVPTFNSSAPNLVDFPPTFQAVGAKPLFFDIAYSGIEYPTRNIERRAQGLERLERGETEAPQGRGLLGRLGSFLGR
ncbi:signal recognition particle subunit srp68, partial [Rhizophlyctis rosea]